MTDVHDNEMDFEGKKYPHDRASGGTQAMTP